MKVVALRGAFSELKSSRLGSQKMFKNLLEQYYIPPVLRAQGRTQDEHEQMKLDLFKDELKQIMAKCNFNETQLMYYLKKLVEEAKDDKSIFSGSIPETFDDTVRKFEEMDKTKTDPDDTEPEDSQVFEDSGL